MRAFFRALPAILFAPVSVLLSAGCVDAQEWMLTSAPNLDWKALACSADGNTIAAVGSGRVYVSTDSGVTWVATGLPASRVALSADGGRLLALSGNWFCVSSDWGATWTSNSTPVGFYNFAASADATRLVATEGIQLYTSTNAGGTWRQVSGPSEPWRELASSADGTHLAATQYDARYPSIYTSTDSGMTWVCRHSFPFGAMGGLTDIASCADGTKLAASGEAGVTSTNSGATWTWAAPLIYVCNSAAISADGARMAFSSGYTRIIYSSSDSGVTWERVSAPSEQWGAIACSADGAKVVSSVGWGGGIYIYQTTPTPKLRVSRFGDNVCLSWIVTSMQFTLQEASEMASANWNNVEATPTLNYTNLQYQVTLPLLSGNRFYRLVPQSQPSAGRLRQPALGWRI